MLNATLCSLPLLADLDSTVSTWKSLPSAFAPKSRQRDSNSLGRFESVPAVKVAMASQKPAICIHLVTSTHPCKITTIELAWLTAQHVRSSFTHFPTCPQYRLMIIAEHGCTELSILLATCHVAKWYCMNCILEVRWPGSRMPHRYVLRTPLFRDTTETPSRLQSSSLPSKPVNGSSTHMALQNHRKCTTPTQMKFNYHMTSPRRSSKKNNFQCHSIICLGISGFSWVSLWPVNFANFRNSAHPSRSVSVPPKAQKASWHTKICLMILLIAEIWQNPCWAWSIWSWIASFYRVVYISGRSGVQETINSTYLPIRRFKRHLPQSTDVAGQLCPSASGDLKTKNKNLTTRQGRWRNMTLLRKRSLYIK